MGFLFLVLYPLLLLLPSFPPLPPSLTLTHSHSLTLTLPHSLTHTHSHSLTHSFTHSLTLTHSLTHSHSLSPQLLRGRRGTISTAKGSDVRPGVPWCRLVSAAFAWQAWHNLHCQGVGCTPWRPLVPFGLRSFCVAGVAQSPLPRGRMYALASPGAVWSPQLLRGRRGTIYFLTMIKPFSTLYLTLRKSVPYFSSFCPLCVGLCHGVFGALKSLRKLIHLQGK